MSWNSGDGTKCLPSAQLDDLRARGKTVITITHDIDFCAEHFGRVVVMAEGRVLLDGPGRVVFAQTETLVRTYVDPPQLARLAMRLGMDAVPLTVEEFIKARLRAGATLGGCDINFRFIE